MKLSEFQRLLDIYGADLLMWPEKEKSSAAQLIASSPEAQSHLEAEQVFAAAVERAWTFPADEGVVAARLIGRALNTIDIIERQTAEHKVPVVTKSRAWPLWTRTGTGGIIAVLLFLLGMGFGSSHVSSADRAAIQSLIINGSYGSSAFL